MSWLLFLDESGHDHMTTPYEVRGGVALHVSELWRFVQSVQRLELEVFGTALNQFRAELEGFQTSRQGSIQMGFPKGAECPTKSGGNIAVAFSPRDWRRNRHPVPSSQPMAKPAWRWRLGCSSCF